MIYTRADIKILKINLNKLLGPINTKFYYLCLRAKRHLEVQAVFSIT